MSTQAQTAMSLESVMIAKVRQRPVVTFFLAIAAGVFVGLGFSFCVTTQIGGAEFGWLGIVKLVSGIAFSTALLLVVISGADLFTSTTMTLFPLSRQRVSMGAWAKHWALVYSGNLLGAILLALALYVSNMQGYSDGAWGDIVVSTTTTKVTYPWIEAFIRGIFANLMVCLAIWGATAGKTLTDKALVVIMPVALFAACGFEHSVANMFMLPMGWLITGGTEAISVGSIVFNNLIPVTLGNIVGGGCMVGLYFGWLHMPRSADAVVDATQNDR